MVFIDYDGIKSMDVSPVRVVVNVDQLNNISFIFKGIVSKYKKATVVLRRVDYGGREKSYDEITVVINHPQSGVKYNTGSRIHLGETNPVCHLLILDDEKYRKNSI